MEKEKGTKDGDDPSPDENIQGYHLKIWQVHNFIILLDLFVVTATKQVHTWMRSLLMNISRRRAGNINKNYGVWSRIVSHKRFLFAIIGGTLAKLQSSMRCKPLSTTCATVSDTSYQSLRLMCFHKLHRRTVNRWTSSRERTCTNWKIVLTTLVVWVQARCIVSHNMVLGQTCIAKDSRRKHIEDHHKGRRKWHKWRGSVLL